MPIYNFVARDQIGRNYRGTLFGPSEQSVFFRLQKQGYVVVSVSEKDDSQRIVIFQPTITQSDVVIFTRLLGTLISTGIPIVDALAAIEEQTTNTSLSKVIRQVREDVEHGASLSASFDKHPKVFPHLFVAMVHSGEIGGNLIEVLERVADYLERDMDLRRSISNAFVYPKIVLTIATVGIAVILRFFVPAISKIYQETPKLKLPAFTKLLITLSNVMVEHWVSILAVAGLIFMTLIYLKSTKAGRPIYETLVLSIPVMGPLYRKIIIARAVRTLGSTLGCGVPLITSLESVKLVTNSAGVSRDLDRVVESVEAGGTISAPLRLSRNFPPMVTYMISSGEQSGRLPKLMDSCAEALEKEIQHLIKRLLIVIEPAITIVIALVVAFIAVAVYLPFYNILTMLPKG